jgi:hypothetical protein
MSLQAPVSQNKAEAARGGVAKKSIPAEERGGCDLFASEDQVIKKLI